MAVTDSIHFFFILMEMQNLYSLQDYICQPAKWLWYVNLFKYLYWRSNTILPLCLNMKANPYNGTKKMLLWGSCPAWASSEFGLAVASIHDRMEIKWERFSLQVHRKPSVYDVKRSAVDNKPSALLSRCLISWAAYGILGRYKRGWGRSQYLVLVFMLACSLCLIPQGESERTLWESFLRSSVKQSCLLVAFFDSWR